MTVASPLGARPALARLCLLACLTTNPLGANATPEVDGTVSCESVASGMRPSLPWLAPGQSTAPLSAALSAMADARSHGLDPDQYRASELAALSAWLRATDDQSTLGWFRIPAAHARFNRRMTDAFACYLAHLRHGVLDRAFAHPQRRDTRDRWNPYAAMMTYWHDGGPGAALAEATPRDPAYQRLRNALARTRAMVQAGLSATTADDVLQPEHLAAPPATSRDLAMIARLELSLERFRWLEPGGAREVVVNLPAYELRYLKDGELALASRVIVGSRRGASTPLMNEPIKRLELAPVWYVPRSIAKRHLLPKMRDNDQYLREKNMRVVWRDRKRTDRIDARVIRAVAANRVRIEQLPGDDNALGAVKFVLPNRQSIYLHGTNQPELFLENRRDRSSGCVRVERARELARLLLDDHRRYSDAWFDHRMGRDKPTWIEPSSEVMVNFLYATVTADEDGRVIEHEDIYGWDRRALELVPRWRVALQDAADARDL